MSSQVRLLLLLLKQLSESAFNLPCVAVLSYMHHPLTIPIPSLSLSGPWMSKEIPLSLKPWFLRGLFTYSPEERLWSNG